MIKAERDSHILSYYTQGGRIFVRTSEDRNVRPVEIPFGLNQNQIKALCQGERVTPTPVAICDQFRAVNSGSHPLQRRADSKQNPWILATRRGRQTNPAAGSSSTCPEPARPSSAQSRQTVTGEGGGPRDGVSQLASAPSYPAGRGEHTARDDGTSQGQGSPADSSDPPDRPADMTGDAGVMSGHDVP